MTAAEDAFEFLRSPDGRAMVTRALQRRGLPLGLRDDLAGEILRRVVGAAAREPIENPAGFATHAAQYAAADLLRGELRRPLPFLSTGREDSDDSEVELVAHDDTDADDPRWGPARLTRSRYASTPNYARPSTTAPPQSTPRPPTSFAPPCAATSR